MNEAEIRAEHIDPALTAAGWGVVEGSRIRREYAIAPGRIEGHGRRGKALTADYVLEHRNTKLAVVEAKAWDEELTESVAQAVVISTHFNSKQQIFLDFVLSHYVRQCHTVGVCPHLLSRVLHRAPIDADQLEAQRTTTTRRSRHGDSWPASTEA